MDWLHDIYDIDTDAEYDSDSTFISYHSDFSNDTLNSSSSASNSNGSTQDLTQDTQPSYMIVNSGTGGIHPRNASSDNGISEDSRSRGSSLDSLDSVNSDAVASNSEDEGEHTEEQGTRYFLRNRNVESPPPPAVPPDSNNSIVSISSGSTVSQGSQPNNNNATENPAQESGSQASTDDLHPGPSVSQTTPITNRSFAPYITRSPARPADRSSSVSPVSKKARLDQSHSSEDGVDGCNICFDSYTTVGPHRPVCLKCGHIFGFSCVDRWLRVSCASGHKRCPTCNKKASLKDVRYLYCCNLRAVDNATVHQLTTDLEQEKIQNAKFKLEITGFKIKVQSLEKELAHFKALEKSGALQSKSLQTVGVSNIPVLLRTVVLCKPNATTPGLGLSRTLVYDEYKKLLLATHHSESNIFSGYGYSLFSLMTAVQSPPAHKFCLVSQKAIRDVAFHPNDSDLILVVSLDKTARLIDVRTGTRIHTFNMDYPLWSCAWDPVNPNLFLVGGVNGQLAKIDKLDTSAGGQVPIVTSGPPTGVISIIGVKPGPGRGLPTGGFLVCKLTSVLSIKSCGSIEVLNSCGPFMSMSYLESKNQVLLSTRPSERFPYIRHQVFTLDKTVDESPVLRNVQTIQGGSLAPSLSRSYIWPTPVQGHSIVYAYDVASKCLCGWSVSDGRKKISLPCNEAIVDICHVESEGEPLLAALSDSAVHLYRHPLK